MEGRNDDGDGDVEVVRLDGVSLPKLSTIKTHKITMKTQSKVMKHLSYSMSVGTIHPQKLGRGARAWPNLQDFPKRG